jgi:Ca2+-binding RTX toxin-like protein
MPYDPGTQFTITSGFGSRNSGNHPGIDFAAPNGTPIPAAADGVVWYSGFNATYGNTVILQHVGHDGTVFYTLYSHMNGAEMRGVGQEVSAGESLGQVGNTGLVFGPTGNHLHFEVITGVDPANAPGGQLGIGPGQGRVDPGTWQDWPEGGVYNPIPGQRGDLGPTPSGDVASSDGGLDPDPDLLIAASGGQPIELISVGFADGEVRRSYNSAGVFYSQSAKELDPDNIHPYSELDIDEDATGKPTAVQLKLDGQPNTAADFSAVGQVLGSALGRALAPNNQFVQLAAGTVIGAIGQKLAQAFAASLTTNGATFDLSRTFADFNVSIASAGASSVASFLVAELGTALHLDGFSGQLFNAAGGGFAGSVASQIASKMAGTASVAGVSFDAAIATLDFGAAATNAGYGISSAIGSFLAHEFVPAQTHEGAVAGQLFGAIGSAAGISAALSGALGSVLGFIVPGVGSLIGTILGTLIGDAFGNVPHPAAVDLLDQAGTLYAATHYQTSASDGGDYSTPDQMAVPALAIINAYLGAVKGAALDHSKQVTLGYQANPVFYIDGVPGHPAIGEYLAPNAAVQAAALDVLQNTEVIGGDLLMKRAHQNSSSIHPQPAPPPDPSTNNGDPGATGTAVQVSAAEQLAVMSGDLSVAQDYENYLNNREAINALMAANPDSAFTAGWIATFARVNELGLNHANASDFLGGLVGWLDSADKAGLGAEAANATVGLSGGAATVDVKVANGAEVPGSLSAFADTMSQSSDATGTTVHFTIAAGLAAAGFHGPASAALDGSGFWQVTGGAGNNLWFGRDDLRNNYHDDNPGQSHDILVGGAQDDIINAGNGFDFIDGGAGNDLLYGADGNDILIGGKGNDALYGGAGNDSYVFNRGDGSDWVQDDGGSDTLVFGAGISVSDVSVYFGGAAKVRLPVWLVFGRPPDDSFASALDDCERRSPPPAVSVASRCDSLWHGAKATRRRSGLPL